MLMTDQPYEQLTMSPRRPALSICVLRATGEADVVWRRGAALTTSGFALYMTKMIVSAGLAGWGVEPEVSERATGEWGRPLRTAM